MMVDIDTYNYISHEAEEWDNMTIIEKEQELRPIRKVLRKTGWIR